MKLHAIKTLALLFTNWTNLPLNWTGRTRLPKTLNPHTCLINLRTTWRTSTQEELDRSASKQADYVLLALFSHTQAKNKDAITLTN